MLQRTATALATKQLVVIAGPEELRTEEAHSLREALLGRDFSVEIFRLTGDFSWAEYSKALGQARWLLLAVRREPDATERLLLERARQLKVPRIGVISLDTSGIRSAGAYALGAVDLLIRRTPMDQAVQPMFRAPHTLLAENLCDPQAVRDIAHSLR